MLELLRLLLGKERTDLLIPWVGIILGACFLIVSLAALVQSVRARRHGHAATFDPATPGPVGPTVFAVFSVLMVTASTFAILGFPRRTPQERAVDAVKEAKGEVEVDETSPGKPVVKVSLRDRPLRDEDLKSLKPHLEALPDLRELDLVHAQISDAGLEYLKGLTGLKVLSLGDSYWPTPLSQAGVDQLGRSLPETKIYYYRCQVFGVPDLRTLEEMRKDLEVRNQGR